MYISLPELEAILKEARDREHRQQRFLAAIQGIDLDAQSKESAQEKLEAAKRRVAAMQSGKPKEEFEFEELDLGYEVEE
jgi:hypothetical protein